MIKQLQRKRRKSIPCSAPASRCGPSQTCCVQSPAKGRRCSAQRYRKIPLALASLEKLPCQPGGCTASCIFFIHMLLLKCALKPARFKVLGSLFLLLVSSDKTQKQASAVDWKRSFKLLVLDYDAM